MPTTATVLIVDDDPGFRKTLHAILKARGYAPTSYATGQEALASVAEQSPAAVLIDLRLEDMSGLQVLAGIKERSPDTECILLTGYASQTSAIEAVNLGAYSYVQKPYDMEQLLLILHRAVEKRTNVQALRESEERYRSIVEYSPAGIAVVDNAYRLTYVNDELCRITNRPRQELVGHDFREFLDESSRDLVGERYMRRQAGNVVTSPYEFNIVHPNGDKRRVEIRPSVIQDAAGKIHTLVQLLDVTERQQMEKQLRQQERLAAVGQLAGGIAHDLNNMLTVIMLYSHNLLRSDLPADMVSDVETMLKETRNAANLVGQVLDFSRRSPMQSSTVDLRPFVKETVRILEHTIPSNIYIRFDPGPYGYTTPLTVEADPTRIQQVLMNLATNARDAMPEGGTLGLELTRVKVQQGEEPPGVGLTPGNWVCLAVSDTGTGMTEDVCARIFEPFFTTKEVGKGTGLGLAQVYGIVKQHGGYISVETELGQGTTFRIYLPFSGAEVPVEDEIADIPLGEDETILLAEDNDQIREAGQELLESLGYRVLTAANGQEALEVYTAEGGADLVITDLMMPAMGGKQLMQALKEATPELEVLAITGYAAEGSLEELKEAGFRDVVHKPFDVNTLARVIRQALDLQRERTSP